MRKDHEVYKLLDCNMRKDTKLILKLLFYNMRKKDNGVSTQITLL